MPFVQLDRACALIVIDLQKALVALPLIHPFSEVLERSVGLIDAFRAVGGPVVLVNTDGLAPGRTAAGPPGFTFRTTGPSWSPS